MNTAIQTLTFGKNRIIVLFIIGVISIIAGLVMFSLMKISYSLIILAEAVLFVTIIVMLARKIKRFLWGILLITIPINIDKNFFLNNSHTGGVEGLVISVWSLVLLSLYIIWLIEYWTVKKEKIHYFSRAIIPLGILLVISIISLSKSVVIDLSLFQIFQFLKVFLLFFYIANNVRTEKDYNFILFILFITLFFEMCLGYYQRITNDYIDLGIFSDAKQRKARELGTVTILGVSGTMSGGHPFADYLTLVLSVLLASLISKGKLFLKVIYLILFTSGIPLIIFTISRGGWSGFIIGLSLFLVLKLILSKNKLLNVVKILALVSITVIFIFSFREIIFNRIYGDDSGSAESRIPMMEIGYEVIKPNPILGVGINNYTVVMEKYDPTGLTYLYKHPVHNIYLHLAAEIGIPGLIAFLWFIITLYVYALKYLKKSNEFFVNQTLGILMGITALLVHGFVNSATIATNPYILFWVYAGLIFAIPNIEQKK